MYRRHGLMTEKSPEGQLKTPPPREKGRNDAPWPGPALGKVPKCKVA